MQEVVLDRNVRLLDSPGVVFDDRSALLGNCVDGESMDDPIPPVAALLKRCNHASLLMTYNIPAFPPGDVMMFLAMVARSHGRVLKGGIPDKVSAARTVLKDWNNGKIPYFTAPPKDAGPSVESDAVVVTQFGQEFDLAKYDEEVLQSLKESDEMDFVKLEDGKESIKMGNASRDTIKFFTEGADEEESDVEDMDEDSGDEDDSDDDGANASGRQAMIASADDYDFDAM